MHGTVEVGTRLEPQVSWPEEGAALTMTAGAPVRLMIFLRRPHHLEVDAVTAAPTRFAWVDGEQAGLLLYRLGPVLSWAQVPYHPHFASPEDGPVGVDAHGAVQIVLVDRDGETVRALHRVHWPAEFADTVRASVARMADIPFSQTAYDHVLAALHRRYPTLEDMLTDRVDATCTAT
ncbi:hypothetical protein ODJ79_43285 [Actinoplanes sp. KI2]|uniref:hypothetical protein n=1 Tax=Actinoplanes sp. KI2 TaxID=2983315 RepID=UPI0021D5BA8A|nr:hypothetical protein [Actinoplanes sp. KI2]MCU7730582.1 hypothetical protein [Actinoplanes sp. KI2]